MSKATFDLGKRLATELKTTKRALKDLQLKDLIATHIPYLKVGIGTTRKIAQNYLDKYLDNFEHASFFDEIKKNPDKCDEILGIFLLHEIEIDDEKQKVVERFSAIIRKNFKTPTDTIDWVKLIQLNNGNYNSDDLRFNT
jgi:hypothetical protein